MIHQSIADIVNSRTVATIAPDQTVREACYRLCDAPEGAVAVVENGALVGIVGEHDVIQRAICANRPTRETQVSTIMTPSPKTVQIDCCVAKALRIMGDCGVRHLPVLDGTRLAGILSIRDVPLQYRLLVERHHEFMAADRPPNEQMTLLV